MIEISIDSRHMQLISSGIINETGKEYITMMNISNMNISNYLNYFDNNKISLVTKNNVLFSTSSINMMHIEEEKVVIYKKNYIAAYQEYSSIAASMVFNNSCVSTDCLYLLFNGIGDFFSKSLLNIDIIFSNFNNQEVNYYLQVILAITLSQILLFLIFIFCYIPRLKLVSKYCRSSIKKLFLITEENLISTSRDCLDRIKNVHHESYSVTNTIRKRRPPITQF